jgi:hypothetical protein
MASASVVKVADDDSARGPSGDGRLHAVRRRIRRNRLAAAARRDDSGSHAHSARSTREQAMQARYLTIALGALVAVALPQASGAAEPAPAATPLMERAFAYAEKGPDELRQFVYRTRMIYALRQADVVKAYEAARGTPPAAAAEDGKRIAAAAPDLR